mmetsp:Transcript_20255/g.59720  ORF Transcript_20255/g.59720 Transcript_20255/m.59720 type:complete len:168 (+) Transcript_20255:18-521(+)
MAAGERDVQPQKPRSQAADAGPSAQAHSPTHRRHTGSREQTCPFLVRVFVTRDVHRRSEHYETWDRPLAPPSQDPSFDPEVHLYTWLDASLAELAELVREVNVMARKPGTRLSFAHVQRDVKHHRIKVKPVGQVPLEYDGPDGAILLADIGFNDGDVIDVAIQSAHI